MTKKKTEEVPAEAVEVKNEQEVVETPIENTDSPDNESEKEELVSTNLIADDIALPKPRGNREASSETIEEKPETITFNEGAEGDAGQTNLNDIPVDFEDISAETKNKDEYVNAHIKLENVLVDLKDIRDKDISFTKNEDLEVTIVYVEHAIESILKLRK